MIRPGSPIRQFPFAPVLIVPLSQHLGNPAKPVVREGQEIDPWADHRRGGRLHVGIRCMHRPRARSRKIGLAPGIAGKMIESVYIEPLPASTQEIEDGEPCDLETATPDEIVAAIQQAGIVGLGGAAFPDPRQAQAAGRQTPGNPVSSTGSSVSLT